jgi:hypothetical protein
MQPKTTGLTIINDILQQIENKSTVGGKGDSKENTAPHLNKSEEDAIGSDGVELQTVKKVTHKEKVIPLYNPDDAVVKVFMIHGSQKSALALAPFALGFQQQVIHI